MVTDVVGLATWGELVVPAPTVVGEGDEVFDELPQAATASAARTARGTSFFKASLREGSRSGPPVGVP